MAVVLITGCSSGFGLAAALGFSAQGDDVIATMRDPSKASGELLGAASVAQLDVTDAAGRRAAVAQVLADFGRIDVLVNNAGISSLGPAEELPDEIIRSQFETNFFGPFALIKEVLPSMREAGSGRIVNVTSIGALLSSGFYSAYCATKHALDAMSLGLDIELQPWGIRVVTVVPGGFNTAIVANRIAAERADTSYPRAAEAIEAYEKRMIGKDDLTPVTDAIIAAATDAEPRARYLVGSGTAEMLAPVVELGESIHRSLRERDRPDQ